MIGWVCGDRVGLGRGGADVRLIFMWTPPHFWALALFMKEDYHAPGCRC
jgi:protoheme IX farnesyltransferase